MGQIQLSQRPSAFMKQVESAHYQKRPNTGRFELAQAVKASSGKVWSGPLPITLEAQRGGDEKRWRRVAQRTSQRDERAQYLRRPNSGRTDLNHDLKVSPGTAWTGPLPTPFAAQRGGEVKRWNQPAHGTRRTGSGSNRAVQSQAFVARSAKGKEKAQVDAQAGVGCRGQKKEREMSNPKSTTALHDVDKLLRESSSQLVDSTPPLMRSSSHCPFTLDKLTPTTCCHLPPEACLPDLLLPENTYEPPLLPLRYLHGLKPEANARNFSPEASASGRGLKIESNVDSTWHLMPAQVPLDPFLKLRHGTHLQNDTPQLHTPQDFEPMIDAAMSKQRQQHCFFGSDLDSPTPVQHEHHPMRPFFDEWPNARDSWSNLDEQRSNKNAFSTTQLSMSIPMTPSEFSTRSACSPNGESPYND
ncbi:hypothetical protein F0562_011910 [Nyssa sinensis]|uniref:Uncharacterized protein n=1 Tax=Nyssa sinensis TaxID=561372 RepID=A0A5J4ZV21_9ASTE|nr:hypothetical protein F0562_011910 [Nyssa sinensis]